VPPPLRWHHLRSLAQISKVSPLTTLSDPHAIFAAAMAEPENQPEVAYAALHALANTLVGTTIFTILALDLEEGLMYRAYSDTQDLYPAPGVDEIGDSIWEQTLIEKREALVLNSAAEVASLLPEHEALFARGAKSMLNLPIVVAGTTIGTLNMLNVEGHFTPEVVAKAYALSAAAAVVLVLS
jgi:GAF domain-containing protein